MDSIEKTLDDIRHITAKTLLTLERIEERLAAWDRIHEDFVEVTKLETPLPKDRS